MSNNASIDSGTVASSGGQERVISDAGGRRALTFCILLSLVVGLAWGYYQYGSLAAVRAWNVFGLVLISVVFFFAFFVGIRAWRNQIEIYREEEAEDAKNA